MPARLPKRDSVYYFRRAVPEDLRPYFQTKSGKPRTEFMISLGVKDLPVAKQKWLEEAVRVDALIQEACKLRDAGISPAMHTKTSKAHDEIQRLQFEAMDEYQAIQDIENAEDEENEAAVIAWLGKPADELSSEELYVKRNMDPTLFMSPEVLAKRERQRKREYEAAAEEVARKFSNGEWKPGEASHPSLEKLFEKYAAGVSPSTAKRWAPVVRHLVDFLGHDDASRITAHNLIDWRDKLLTEGGADGPVSARTVRDGYFAAVKALLTDAFQNKVIPSNPALGVKVRVPRQRILRPNKGFTQDEVRLILTATKQPQSDRVSPENKLSRRWVPWICAYTGARVGEITQLRECDIFKEDGVWAIAITPEAGTIKNNTARTVPIHSHLIEQGLLELAKADSERPLFYDPSRGRGGTKGNPHAKKAADRLGEWVRSLGVTDPNVAPNHGWRHLFKTRGYDQDIPDAVLDRICGHAASSEGQKYGHRSAASLSTHIEKMPRFPH